MSEILTWHELGSAFPHSAIEALDSAGFTITKKEN